MRPVLQIARAGSHFGMVVALAGAGVGCSRATAHRGKGGAPAPEPATVAFVNQSLQQASVYAIGMSGEWFRLGTVFGGQTARLRVPQGLTATNQTINIVARPLATTRLATSGPVTVSPGATYTVTLPISENLLSVLPGLP